MTGFFRDGYCRVGPQDGGNHAVAGMYRNYLLFPSISTALESLGWEKEPQKSNVASFINLHFKSTPSIKHLLTLLASIGLRNLPGVLTREFLDFSASRGNNLRSIGLEPGCKWCLCTTRWKEALDARKSDNDPVVPKYVPFFSPALSILAV